MVTGSCREEEQVQLWDVRKPDAPTVSYDLPRMANGGAEMIATAQFIKWGADNECLYQHFSSPSNILFTSNF